MIVIERLINKFGVNEPIFTNEILEELKEYSRARVFQLLKKAEDEKKIIKFDNGIYYIPTKTRYGLSLISVEQVVEKKFITNNDEVYGLYGGLQMRQNFMLTMQIPSSIEIITNKETMSVRKTLLKSRKIILHKSCLPITKENFDAYTILELFTNIDVKDYLNNLMAQKEVVNFIKEKEIKSKDVSKLASFFPAKTTKNIMESGIINYFMTL